MVAALKCRRTLLAAIMGLQSPFHLLRRFTAEIVRRVHQRATRGAEVPAPSAGAGAERFALGSSGKGQEVSTDER